MPIEIEHAQQKEIDKPKFNDLFGLRNYLDKIIEESGKNKPFNLKSLAQLKWPAKVVQFPLNGKAENFGKTLVVERLNPDYGPFRILIESQPQKNLTESTKQQYVLELKFGSSDGELSLFKAIDRKGSKFVEVEKLNTDLEYLTSVFSNITQENQA